jgi:uncharacterized membrane protein YagU involved in acid resistance
LIGKSKGDTMKNQDVAIDAVKGALAGAVAVWVMDRVTWDLYRNQPPEAFRQEKEAQVEDTFAAQVAAKKAAEATGTDLSEEQVYDRGQVIHYAIGMLPGALYGALRDRREGVGTWRGLAYGLALFLIADELLNPLLGLTSGPTRYPWQTHARGLIGHLVLGGVTDTVFDVLSQAAGTQSKST